MTRTASLLLRIKVSIWNSFTLVWLVSALSFHQHITNKKQGRTASNMTKHSVMLWNHIYMYVSIYIYIKRTGETKGQNKEVWLLKIWGKVHHFWATYKQGGRREANEEGKTEKGQMTEEQQAGLCWRQCPAPSSRPAHIWTDLFYPGFSILLTFLRKGWRAQTTRQASVPLYYEFGVKL